MTGIICKLGIWFFQVFTKRTYYVRIPGGISEDSPVLSGVPQGTVLGPLLLLIMISDINQGTTSSKLISFPDDTQVYSNITKADDCDSAQHTQTHDKTHPQTIKEHLQLHASQIRKKSEHPTHPHHYITTIHNTSLQKTLHRATRRSLVKRRTNKCPLLR